VGAIAEQEFVCKNFSYIDDVEYKFSGLRLLKYHKTSSVGLGMINILKDL
jgi:hypothetical protein